VIVVVYLRKREKKMMLNVGTIKRKELVDRERKKPRQQLAGSWI